MNSLPEPDPGYAMVPSAPHSPAGPMGMALSPQVFVPAGAPVRVIALEDVVRCIVQRWKLAAIVATIMAALVLALMLGRVRQFQAEASLVMRLRDDKVFNFEKVVDNSNEFHSAPLLLNNHKVQLKSRRFLEYFHDRLSPADRAAFLAPPSDKPFVAKLLESLRAAPPPSTRSPEEEERTAFFKACDAALVDFIKETLIIKVSLRHHQPDVAAQMANAWIDAYIAYVGHEENTTTRHATAFLQKQADDLRERVETCERRLATFRSEKGLPDDEELKAGSTEKLKILTTELASAEMQLLKVKQSMSQVEAAHGDIEALLSIEALAQAPSIAALRSQLTEKRREQSVITNEYGPRHPAWQNFQRGFADFATEVRRNLDRVTGEMRNRATALEKQITSVTARIKETSSQSASNGGENAEKRILTSQLAADRDSYNKILQRLNEAAITSQFNETTHLRPAETAVTPEKAVAPNKPLAVVLAGVSFGGVFVTLPLALAAVSLIRRRGIMGLFESSRSGPASLEKRSLPPPLPANGSLPCRQTRPAALPERTWAGMVVSGNVPALPPPPDYRRDQMLAGIFRSNAPVRAIFEKCAASLTAPGNDVQPVILVTSTRTDEGKSLSAAALGVACVAHGKSALIIDCNFRHPSVHRWLPRPTTGATLRDICAAHGAIHLDLDSLRCGTSELYSLLCGGTIADPSVLFSRPWFYGLLEFLKPHVDVVILDAPAINAGPEVVALAERATHAVMVCRPSITGEAECDNAASFLSRMAPCLNAPVCLLNEGPSPANDGLVA